MYTITQKTIWASLLVLSFGLTGKATLAQVATPRPTPVSEKVTDPPKAVPAKPHKVWTDDDVTTLRTPADQYAAQRASQEEAAAAAAAKTKADAAKSATAPANYPEGAKPAHAALSDPKSTEEADKMIAWENRDLDAQADYVRQMQECASNSSGSQRDHCLAEKARMEGVMAQTQQEVKALKTQKTDLEKPKPQQ
jgi:hypothetical protein